MADAAIQSLARVRPDSGEAHLALAMHLYLVYFDYDRARAEVGLAKKSLPKRSGYFLARRLHRPTEEGTSAWLARNVPTAFSEHRERLVRDFTLAEILLFFARAEFDWQLAATTLRGSMGTMTTAQPVSKEKDCTRVCSADFVALLKKTGNVLAGYDFPTPLGGAVCFPPGTKITPTENSITLSNPFGSLQFVVEPSGDILFSEPGTNEPSPLLPNGESQFETRVFPLRVVNRQNALYSQHRDAAKQAAWRQRVINGLHSWFEQQ